SQSIEHRPFFDLQLRKSLSFVLDLFPDALEFPIGRRAARRARQHQEHPQHESQTATTELRHVLTILRRETRLPMAPKIQPVATRKTAPSRSKNRTWPTDHKAPANPSIC